MLEVIDPTTIESKLAEYASMTTEKLREALATSLNLTAMSLLSCGCIVRTLEDRGEDLAELRIGIVPLLRKIAYGQLLPGLVAKYAGNGKLLQRLSNLPLPDQQKMLSGKPIKIMIIGNDGTDARMVEPHKMSLQEVCQVFAPDHIRDEGEQVSWLRSRRPLPRGNETSEDIVIDKRRGGVTINGRFLNKSELASILARIMD